MVAGLMMGAAVFLMIGTFDALWAIVLDDLDASEWVANIGITLFALPLIFLSSWGGRLAQRVGPFRLGPLGLLIGAGFMFSYGFLPTGIAMFSVGIFHGISDGITVSSTGVAVGLAAPAERQAGAQGMLGAAETLTGGVTAVLAGVLYTVGRPLAGLHRVRRHHGRARRRGVCAGRRRVPQPTGAPPRDENPRPGVRRHRSRVRPAVPPGSGFDGVMSRSTSSDGASPSARASTSWCSSSIGWWPESAERRACSGSRTSDGVDEQVSPVDLDEQRLLVVDGLVDQCRLGLRSPGGLELVHPVAEPTDLIGVHDANRELQHDQASSIGSAVTCPSMRSRSRSAWPTCWAYSSIMWISTHRNDIGPRHFSMPVTSRSGRRGDELLGERDLATPHGPRHVDHALGRPQLRGSRRRGHRGRRTAAARRRRPSRCGTTRSRPRRGGGTSPRSDIVDGSTERRAICSASRPRHFSLERGALLSEEVGQRRRVRRRSPQDRDPGTASRRAAVIELECRMSGERTGPRLVSAWWSAQASAMRAQRVGGVDPPVESGQHEAEPHEADPDQEEQPGTPQRVDLAQIDGQQFGRP